MNKRIRNKIEKKRNRHKLLLQAFDNKIREKFNAYRDKYPEISVASATMDTNSIQYMMVAIACYEKFEKQCI